MITTLQVPYADVRAADLRWSQTAAPLPALDRLRVPVDGGGQIDLVIVGCSHQVTVDVPGLRLTETVARLAEGGRPLSPRVSSRTADGARYRFESRVDDHAEEDFDAAVEALLGTLHDPGRTLVGRFPGRPGAVTALRCDRADGEALAWRTWHTYPGTGEVVVTRSELGRP